MVRCALLGARRRNGRSAMVPGPQAWEVAGRGGGGGKKQSLYPLYRQRLIAHVCAPRTRRTLMLCVHSYIRTCVEDGEERRAAGDNDGNRRETDIRSERRKEQKREAMVNGYGVRERSSGKAGRREEGKKKRENERECDGAIIREKDRVVLYEARDVSQDRKLISRILRDICFVN